MPPSPETPRRPPATTLRVVAAVLWGFFGVRKRAQLDEDAASIRPHQIIVAGILVAALFVVVLLAIARLVVRLAAP